MTVQISHKWEDIAEQLGYSDNIIEEIKRTIPQEDGPRARLRRVFQIWKKDFPGGYSWAKLLEVLETPAVDAKRLAQELRDILPRQ